MALSVKIESFEGPLDLLLHLIDVNKFNIFDIPIVEITAQYMEYLKSMETEDLNVMSEFLVMAATLLEIKAKMLLPAEVDEEGEEIDPREDLVQKLLEYKMYKYMSYELKDRLSVSGKVLYKDPTIPEEVAKYEQPVDLEELVGKRVWYFQCFGHLLEESDKYTVTYENMGHYGFQYMDGNTDFDILKVNITEETGND